MLSVVVMQTVSYSQIELDNFNSRLCLQTLFSRYREKNKIIIKLPIIKVIPNQIPYPFIYVQNPNQQKMKETQKINPTKNILCTHTNMSFHETRRIQSSTMSFPPFLLSASVLHPCKTCFRLLFLIINVYTCRYRSE